MKAILATCVALSFLTGLAGEAGAAANRKHKHYSGRHDGTKTPSYRARSEFFDPNATPAWYPHNSSVLPVGSKIWWDEKARESGGGTRD